MFKFIDEIHIQVKAGNGGPGCISFRREKFIPLGGPDGGDGGKGGNVYIQSDPRIINLEHLQKDRCYSAGNGEHGSGVNRTGKDGEDITIKVPYGTVLYNDEGELVHDFLDDEPFLVAEGARGGKGNAFFKSSTFQSPRFSQPGEHCEKFGIKLSLKLIADVGLVGFPNAGKSTLLKTLTRANPKIGDYPFTTLSPNLGTLELDNKHTCIIADIPGILEGASKGYGLGLSFLKHIERVRLLIFVLDVTMTDVEDELRILRSELDSYNQNLNKRPFIVLFNKCDLMEEEFLNEWVASFKKIKLNPVLVSAINSTNLDKLVSEITRLLSE